MNIKAVFLDRDGILNEYLPGDYVKAPAEFRLIPGVAVAIRRLNDAGLPVIVTSNQQGVGKGVMTLVDLDAVEQCMRRLLLNEAGARLDKCLYCTDLSSVSSPRRKPAPGMLLEAADAFGIAPSQAVMIGDSPTDIAAGRAAGVAASLLVLTGAIRSYAEGDMSPAPDHVFSDLESAVEWTLETNRHAQHV